MSIDKDVKVCFSEAHAGLGPAYLEIRFGTQVPPVVYDDVLLFVEAHFIKAVEAHGIMPQPIRLGEAFDGTILTMNLPQYICVPKGQYLDQLDDCAMQFGRDLPGLIRELTAA